MRCINWRAVRVAVAVGVVGAASEIVGGASGATKHVEVVDDAVTGEAVLGRFDFIGHWQHVRGKHDGRSNGTSTRSTNIGDVAIFNFVGTRVRVFGIRGPSGGRAGISLDRVSTGPGPVDFYAPRIHTHALIYQSPVLPRGVHTLTIVVWGTRNVHGHFYYVNIDGTEVES